MKYLFTKKALLRTTSIMIVLTGNSFAETLLDKVKVDGKKLNKKTVSSEQLNRDGGFSNLYKLDKTTGVTISGTPRPGYGAINIRGYGDSNVNMSTKKVTIGIDGMTQIIDGYRQPSFIGDMSIYKKADITIGSGVDKIGGGIAGNVNFVTQSTADVLKGKQQLTKWAFEYAKNNDEKLYFVTHGQKFNSKFSGFVHYSLRRSGDMKGWYTAKVGSTGWNKGKLHNMVTDSNSYVAKLNGKATNGEWELKNSVYKSNRYEGAEVYTTENSYQLNMRRTNDLQGKYTTDINNQYVNKLTFVVGRASATNDKSATIGSNLYSSGGAKRYSRINQIEMLGDGVYKGQQFRFGVQYRDALNTERQNKGRTGTNTMSRDEELSNGLDPKKSGRKYVLGWLKEGDGPKKGRANHYHDTSDNVKSSVAYSSMFNYFNSGKPDQNTPFYRYSAEQMESMKKYCGASFGGRCFFKNDIRSGWEKRLVTSSDKNDKYYYGHSPKQNYDSAGNEISSQESGKSYYLQGDGTFKDTKDKNENMPDVDYNTTDADNRFVLYGKQEIKGVFAETTYQYNDKTNIVIGGRLDHASWKALGKQVGVAGRTQKNKLAKSFNATALYDLDNNIQLRAGVANADQIFSVRDALYRGKYSIDNNGKYSRTEVERWWGSMDSAKLPNLTTYKVGGRYTKGKLTIDGELYQNYMKNELKRSYGVFNSQTRGFDIEATYVYSSKLLFTGSYQAVSGKYTGVVKRNPHAFYGTFAPVKGDKYNVIPIKVLLGANYLPKKNLAIRLEADIASGDDINYAGYKKSYGYTLLNMYLTYKPKSYNGKVQLSVTNITDKVYRNRLESGEMWRPGPARNILLRYSVEF